MSSELKSHVCYRVVKASEVTARLVESNGSLPPGGWLKVACGLTADLYTGISSGPSAR